MGWCGGATEIFDNMVGVILSEVQDDGIRLNLIYALVIELEWQDWDCQSDSSYYDHPIVQKVFKSRHPDWYEEEKEPCPCPECGGSGRRTGTGIMEDPNDPTGEPLPYPIEAVCGTCGGNGFM